VRDAQRERHTHTETERQRAKKKQTEETEREGHGNTPEPKEFRDQFIIAEIHQEEEWDQKQEGRDDEVRDLIQKRVRRGKVKGEGGGLHLHE
jgi:hypothetical protein